MGTEPRGCALTPNGTLLYVANHTEGTVSIIITSNPLNPILDGAVQVGRNPTAIAITNDGDGDDADETVFVTQIFAELDPNFVDPFDVVVRCAISGNEGSSRPSRRAMPIRRSPKSPSPRSPIPALPPTARTSAPAPPPNLYSLLPDPDDRN